MVKKTFPLMRKAYEILTDVKRKMKEEGFGSPSFSDVVRWLYENKHITKENKGVVESAITTGYNLTRYFLSQGRETKFAIKKGLEQVLIMVAPLRIPLHKLQEKIGGTMELMELDEDQKALGEGRRERRGNILELQFYR